MISLTVEDLRNGTMRATSRVSGCTIKWMDVPAAEMSRSVCVAVLRPAAFSREISPGQFVGVEMNELAKKFME